MLGKLLAKSKSAPQAGGEASSTAIFGKLLGKKRPPLLGVDISASSVKVLELSRTGDHYRVERYAVEPMPQNAMVEHSITEVEQVAQAIARAVKRSGSRLKHAALAVAGSHVIGKVVNMPAGLSDRARLDKNRDQGQQAKAQESSPRAEYRHLHAQPPDRLMVTTH